MAVTKAIIVPSATSVAGNTTVTLDGSTSTAADTTTIAGSFLWEQIRGPLVSLKATSGHEVLNDIVSFVTPVNSPGQIIGVRLTVKDSGKVDAVKGSNTSADVNVTITS